MSISTTVGTRGSWTCLSICQVKVVCAHHQTECARFGIIGYLFFLWESLGLGDQREQRVSFEFHQGSSWGLLTRRADGSGGKDENAPVRVLFRKGVRGITEVLLIAGAAT